MTTDYEFTTAQAATELSGHTHSIGNLEPTLSAWLSHRYASPDFTGDDTHTEAARALLKHADRLRRALNALEETAQDIIDTQARRKAALQDTFFGDEE